MVMKNLPTAYDFLARCRVRIKTIIDRAYSILSLPESADKSFRLSEYESSFTPTQNSNDFPPAIPNPQAIVHSSSRSIAPSVTGNSRTHDYNNFQNRNLALPSPAVEDAVSPTVDRASSSTDTSAPGLEGQGFRVQLNSYESAESASDFLYRTMPSEPQDQHEPVSIDQLCTVCTACFESRSVVRLLRCGHLTTCAGCAHRILNCPKCHGRIVGTEPILRTG